MVIILQTFRKKLQKPEASESKLDYKSDMTVHVCDPRSDMTVHVCDPRSDATVHVCDPCTQEAEEGGSL